MLPALSAAAAQGIAGSNLTILNGTGGVSQVLTGLVGQGFSILDTLRKSTAPAGGNGRIQAPSAEIVPGDVSVAVEVAGDGRHDPSAADVGMAGDGRHDLSVAGVGMAGDGRHDLSVAGVEMAGAADVSAP